MTVWYKVDERRCSWRLLWARSPSVLGFLVLVVMLKLLRYKPPAIGGVSPDRAHRRIEPDEMPAAAQGALRTIIDECGKHSFRIEHYYTSEFLGDAEGYIANMLQADGRVRSTAIWTRAGKTIERGCAFTTRLQSGAIYSTSNLRRSSDLAAGMYSFSYPGASIDEILSHHQNLLRELGEEAAVSLTAEQLPEEVSEIRRRTQAFSIARGALKPMTRAEVERLTVVKAELVLEPSDNPFRSPLADEAELAPRPRSAWRAVLIGAFYGFALGLLVRLWFGAGAEPPPNATLWEKWLLILRFFGWQALPALVGAFLGWWVWRRAQQRAAVSITSN